MSETIKQIYRFFLILVAVLSVLGGTAYLFSDGHALFGVANIGLSLMAMPYFIGEMKEMQKVVRAKKTEGK